MQYLTFIFSLIMPVYALPFSMVQSIKKNTGRTPIISIALAFASISFAITPIGEFDLTRHYEHILSLNNLSFSQVVEKSQPGYLLFDIYAWFLNTMRLPKELFPATTTFIAYYLIFSIFNDLKKNFSTKLNYKSLILIFLSLWLSISFVGLASGIRSGLSSAILIYALYHLTLYKNIKLYLVASIIAFFIHPFALATSAFTLIALYLSPWFKHGKTFIFIGLFFFISSNYIFSAINYINNFMSQFAFYNAGYLDLNSEFGGGFKRNLAGTIHTVILPRLTEFIGISYLLLIKPKSKNILYILLCLLVMYLGFFSSFYTLYFRMSGMFSFAFALFIIIEYINNKSKFNKYYLIAYMISVLILSLANIYAYYTTFLSTAKEAFYKPLLFLLFQI